MPQKKIVMDNIKVKQESIFNMPELYKALFSWFANYGYNFHEQEYNEADAGKGKNIKFFWVAEKNIDSYIRWQIELNAMILGMESIELERNGLKLKTNKASVEFRITATMIKDYDGKWSKGPGMGTLRRVYDKIMIRKRLSRLEGDLERETNKVIDEIKAFLNLYRI